MPIYEIVTHAETLPNGLIRVKATVFRGTVNPNWQMHYVPAKNARHAKDKAKAMRFEFEKQMRFEFEKQRIV
jgi:hypothetical protein